MTSARAAAGLYFCSAHVSSHRFLTLVDVDGKPSRDIDNDNSIPYKYRETDLGGGWVPSKSQRMGELLAQFQSFYLDITLNFIRASKVMH